MLNVLRAAALLLLAGPSLAVQELVVQPGPSFFRASGGSEIFTDPSLFCGAQYIGYPLQTLHMFLYAPDSVEAYPGCSTGWMLAHIVLERRAAAVLPAIGSSATIPIEVTRLHYDRTPMLLCRDDGGYWRVDIDPSPTHGSTGTMTIRRESEFGGTLDVQLRLYLIHDFFFYMSWGPTGDHMIADLGPFDVEAKQVGWQLLTGAGSEASRFCPACAGNFVVEGMHLAGYGNSQGDDARNPIRLQNSRISMNVVPGCTVTALRPDTWSRIKSLYRSVGRP